MTKTITVREWIDSMNSVHKIENLINKAIEQSSFGERWLYDAQIQYLIRRREALTGKDYKGPFERTYKEIKRLKFTDDLLDETITV